MAPVEHYGSECSADALNHVEDEHVDGPITYVEESTTVEWATAMI